MKKVILLISMCFYIVSCKQGNSIDKYQTNRNNEINVCNQVKEILIDENDILISGSSMIYTLGNFLLIQDFHSYENLVSIFDKHTFKYQGSTGHFGEGPTEIAVQGTLGINEKDNVFYITDHAKLKVFRFEMDSVLLDPIGYVPSVLLNLNPENFPVDYDYINDTLCIGRTIVPIGVNDFAPSLSKWNMQTGKITVLSGDAPPIAHKRITVASSSDYRLALEIHNYNDLISIFDFDGQLKCNIYGPEWNNKKERNIHYFDTGVFCKNNKFIVSYSGGDRNGKEYDATKLMVFDINGDYIKTLDIGYRIRKFSYDKEDDRLFFTFNDTIQFGYLDLKGLI